METRGLGRFTRIISSSISIALLMSCVSGCTGSSKRSDPYRPVPKSDSAVETSESEQDREDQANKQEKPGGIFEEPSDDKDAKAYGPAPTRIVPLTVVLGPGLARGFAYAGVLQALRKEGIPIGMIAATGTGALIGALYATSSNDNEFDWALQKIREDLFFESNLSLSKIFGGPNSGKHLRSQLGKLFKTQSFAATKVPLRVGIHSDLARSFEFVGKGRLAGVLRVALSERELFEAGEWYGAPSWSASLTRPYPVREAREIVNAPVLVVNVLEDDSVGGADSEAEKRYLSNMQKSLRLGRSSLRQADLVLEPSMPNIGYFDFKRRSEAIFAGKRVVEDQIAAIRQLTGMLPREEAQ